MVARFVRPDLDRLERVESAAANLGFVGHRPVSIPGSEQMVHVVHECVTDGEQLLVMEVIIGCQQGVPFLQRMAGIRGRRLVNAHDARDATTMGDMSMPA